ncbi:MAG: calcium/sodium antiporter [Gammaproteobacteria bacterium]|nr:calcium/sodium antiporter [Gammaproteobacteria bacterium]
MLLAVLATVIGITLTVVSADKFVDGASALADRLGMSHFLIGLTIVSIGTSAPELLVSAVAAYQGSPGIALGNALGSNITNIALVLGATAVIWPLLVPRPLVVRDLPILLGISTLIALLTLRPDFDRVAGVVLLLILPVLLYRLVKDEAASGESVEIPALSLPMALALTIGGLAVLLGGSRLLVWGATEIALFFGISELVIGLTIVAVGTSLPELAASLASARRGQTDMALGTVIGSNLFNFLGVIGLAAVIRPFAIDPDVLSRDMPWTFGLTLLLFLFARFAAAGTLKRHHGILFLLLYVGYLLHIAATIVPSS